MIMRIPVTMTEQDYVKLTEYMFRHTKRGKRSLWFYRLFVPVICVLLLVTDFLRYENEMDFFLQDFLLYAGISLLWQLIVHICLKASFRLYVKRIRGAGKSLYMEETTMEVGEHGFTEKTEHALFEFAWSDLVYAGRTEEAFYLFPDEALAFPIPRRCMEDHGEALEKLLEEKGVPFRS